MKRCPTCQQTYPENGPDVCAYDDMLLVSDGSLQYQGDPPPGGYPPPPGGGYPPPGGGYPPQGGGYPPQGGGYPPPGQPPPYGSPYPPMGGSKALSTATFLCGLIAIIILAAIVVWYVLARNGAMDFDTMFTLARILQPLAWVMMLAGLASIVLGIVTLVMAGKNPALNKPKAIIGMCMGVISLVVYFTLVGMTIGY